MIPALRDDQGWRPGGWECGSPEGGKGKGGMEVDLGRGTESMRTEPRADGLECHILLGYAKDDGLHANVSATEM